MSSRRGGGHLGRGDGDRQFCRLDRLDLTVTTQEVLLSLSHSVLTCGLVWPGIGAQAAMTSGSFMTP